MTCLKGQALLRAWLIAAIAALGGCGGDPATVLLSLADPPADAVLTMDDDQDPDTPGLQLEVRGESRGLDLGTTVNVLIDGERVDEEGRVDADGDVAIGGVTLPRGTHELQLRTSTGSARSDSQSFTFKALEITAPMDRAELTGLDDLDPELAGVQINVAVDSWAIDLEAAVELLVDDAAVMTASPDDEGAVSFAGVTLSDGSHTLQARTGEDDTLVESAEIEVDVRGACAAVDFITPAPPASGDLTLGGNGSCPADGDFAIDVEIATNAGDGRDIAIFVNDQRVDSGTVDGSTATFDGVTLPRRDSANTLSVEVENAAGITCRVDYPADIRVDCAGPDCTIDAPMPRLVGSGGPSYLNAALLGDDGFDFVIGTSAEGVGNAVSLILDGRVRDALTTDAVAEGDGGEAAFGGVDLADGAHTIEAQCRDAAGNVTSTGELTWTVDTTPCTVDITDPTNGTLFIEADDEVGSGDPADDIQVVATSTVAGDDCTGRRAAVCDPATGIAQGAFAAHDGSSPLLSTITLDPTTVAQALCVEIEDAAGNVGRDSVAVSFRDRDDTPVLEIESPADETSFNALGDGSHEGDVDRSSSNACDASFVVACNELGVDVELYNDAPTGSPRGSAECVADAAAPAGFAGRARFDAPFGDGDTRARLVAAQTVLSSAGDPLVGVSPAIDLDGDCRLPTADFLGDPCELAGSNQISTAEAVDFDLVLRDSTLDTESASLTLTRGSTDTSFSPTTSDGERATFVGLDLGGEGTITLTGEVVDPFGNEATTSCSVEIVPDLPSIVSFETVGATSFGPGEGCDPPSAPGSYGVPVLALVDIAENRLATITVNGGTPIDVSVTPSGMMMGGEEMGRISACIPVPDDALNPVTPGASSLLLTVNSTVPPGVAMEQISVNVQTLTIDAPDGASPIVDGSCGGPGLGRTITFTADPVLDGVDVTLVADNNTASDNQLVVSAIDVMGAPDPIVSGCLTLAGAIAQQGDVTIEARVDGTVLATQDVFVVYSAPAGPAIVIDDPIEPELDDPLYRDEVLVEWDLPAEQYPGQYRSYELRCDDSELSGDAEVWWSAATEVSDLGGLTPLDPGPKHGVPLILRPYDPTHCVVRGLDVNGDYSGISSSTDVTLHLRQVVLGTGSRASLGFSVATVGNVDGDAGGLDDVLVGGEGEAALFFGRAGAQASAPDVVFTSTTSTAIGTQVAGLGDFNGDGIDDFAINDWGLDSNAGRVVIFFGRDAAAWTALSPIDLETSASVCPGDVCLHGEAANTGVGWTLASAGNFDGAGAADVAIGLPFAGGNTEGQVMVVLGEALERRTCTGTMPDECRGVETCAIDDGADPGSQMYCQLTGDDVWGLRYGVPSGTWLDAPTGTPEVLRGFLLEFDVSNAFFGEEVDSIGDVDGDSGDDLIISSTGVDRVDLLVGRPWQSGGDRLNVLDTTDLGMTGRTAVPLVSGGNLGNNMTAVGDVFAIPDAGIDDRPDFAVAGPTTDDFYLYLGDVGPDMMDEPFDVADRLRDNRGNTNTGESFARGYHAGLDRTVVDVDGDGLLDLCVGTRVRQDVFTDSRPFLLWYHDRLSASVPGGTIPGASALLVSVGCTVESNTCVLLDAETYNLEVQFVGDVNGDGHPDIVVGDYKAESGAGRAVLLY